MESAKRHAHATKSGEPTTTENAKMIQEMMTPSPGRIVFVGLCLFIIKRDRVTVAMLKDTSEAHGASGHAHQPFKYVHANDIVTLGIRGEVRSFPDDEGGQWIGLGMQPEDEYGSPANGRPQFSALETSTFRVPDLASLGNPTAPRQLKTTWPNEAAAVVDLYGGVLTTQAPLVDEFRLNWIFRLLGTQRPDYDQMYLAEQVVWTSGDNGPTFLITNVPFATVAQEGESEDQLGHFAMFYNVFKETAKDPVLVPSAPDKEIEVYPIFCPPAMFIEER